LIQKFKLDHKFEDWSHIHVWIQFHKNKNLPICQWDSQKYEIGQVQFINHKRLVIQFHNWLARNPILTQEKAWNQVKYLSHYWIRNWNWIIRLRFRIIFMLKINLRKRITCQNVNRIFKIWSLVKFKWVCGNWILVSKTTWFLV